MAVTPEPPSLRKVLVVGCLLGLASIVLGMSLVALTDEVLKRKPEDVTAFATVTLATATGLLGAFSYLTIRENRASISAAQTQASNMGELATKTGELATKTGEQAAETRKLADRAQEQMALLQTQADALTRQADAATQSVAEIRASREIELRPYLVVRRELIGGAEASETLSLSNIGRGVAINCVYCYNRRGSAKFQVSRLMHIGPGQTEPFAIVETKASWVKHALVRLDQESLDLEEVCLCEDQFGRMYRFIPARSQPQTWAPGEPGKQPRWTEWERG